MRSRLTIGLAIFLLAAPAAAAADCSRYAHGEVKLDMNDREVRKAVVGREAGEGKIGSGRTARSVELYEGGSAGTLRVFYDGLTKGKHEARVIAIETEFTASEGNTPPPFEAWLRRLGRPSAGEEHLAHELADGEAVWLDADCAVRVRVFRRTPDWWEPGERTGFVVRSEVWKAAQLSAAGRD